jgi:hypothetical protein
MRTRRWARLRRALLRRRLLLHDSVRVAAPRRSALARSRTEPSARKLRSRPDRLPGAAGTEPSPVGLIKAPRRDMEGDHTHGRKS